ncbi:MAG TPA: DUF3079 domain-containing protein [Alicycliphilus sp.]|nr:DUF3079 domain-containing protein [Alicycliphilus sp.]
MRKKFPLHPAHPERTCWGCDRYCAFDAMQCGNGSERSQHPSELFGPDWAEWEPPGADDTTPPDSKNGKDDPHAG